MNVLLPPLIAIFLRATWVMLGAMLLIGILHRRRPLAASSVLTATIAGLLALPVMFALLPVLPIPVLATTDEHRENPVNKTSFDQESVEKAASDGLRVNSHAIQKSDDEEVRQLSATDPQVAPVRLPPIQRQAGRGAAENQQQDRAQTSQIIDAFVPGSQPRWRAWPLLIIVVYLSGITFLVVQLIVGLWTVHRLRTAAGTVDGVWAERLAYWQQRLDVTRHVQLLVSETVNVPMTVGWRHPAILLPKSILDSQATHQDAVLLHELAHIRRLDFVDVVTLQLVQIIYWCHPLVWVVGIVGRNLRERACDEICVHWMGDSSAYRGALLSIAKQTICRPRLAIGLAMAQTSRLGRRISQIQRSKGSSRCISTKSVQLTVYCGILTAATIAANGQLVPRTAVAQSINEQGPSKKDPAKANPDSTLVAQADVQVATANAANTNRNQPSDPSISDYEQSQAKIENGGKLPESLIAIFGSSKLKHWSFVSDVAWSPDGSRLGSTGADGCLRLWNPDTGEQLKRFKSEPLWLNGGAFLTSLSFDPTGERVAAGLLTNAVRIWDIETGEETQLLKDDSPVARVAWHPTKPLLATGGELVAKLWDITSGKVLRSLSSRDETFKRKFTNDVVQVTFAPDGQHVIVGHPDGSIRYWNVETGEVTRTIDAHKVAIQVMVIDASRDRLASGDYEGKLALWRLSTGEALNDIQAHDRYIQGLAFHPQQDLIYSSALDGEIRAWDLRTGKKVLEFVASHRVGPGHIAMHPFRNLIASAGNSVRLWDSTSGNPHLETNGPLAGISSLKLTPDGTRIVTTANDGSVHVWNSESGLELASFLAKSAPSSIAVMPDNKSFATLGSYDGAIDIRDLQNGTILKSFNTGPDQGEGITVSGDGRWLATTSNGRNQTAKFMIWNLATGSFHGRISLPLGRPYFSADGSKLLVIGSEYQYQSRTEKSRLSIWEVQSRKNLLSLDEVQGLVRISASDLSLDGNTLAVVGTAYDENEKSHEQLVLWDWSKNSTRLVVEMEKHQPQLVAIAPDGKSLMTGSSLQGEIKFWDPRDGTLRQTIQCEGGYLAFGAAAFTADSRQIAIAMGNGTIYMFRVPHAPETVATKVSVPEEYREPDPDQWKSLIGEAAPEFHSQGWLFGTPTTLQELRGRWVILYFWNNAFSEQDMPSWIDLQQRFGEQGPVVIVVKKPHAESNEKERDYFEYISREYLDKRPLPFRVMIDQREPNVIPGTKIETGGATHAAYRVADVRRGYLTISIALLIGPDGTVRQQIANRPNRRTIRDLENVTGLKAETPSWETTLLKENRLPDGEILRRITPPNSSARENFRFFNQGRGTKTTMVFEQGETLKQTRINSASPSPLEFVLDTITRFKSYEFLDPDHVTERTVEGDWTVRTGIDREQLLKAVERILRDELNWKIRFERTSLKQEVVVATGKWKRAVLPGMEEKSGVYLTVDESPNPTSGGGGSGSLERMFEWAGDRLCIRFISEVTESPSNPFSFQDRLVDDMKEIRNRTPLGKEKLAQFLKNLTRQTGLTFQMEERGVDVWRIVAE